MSTIGGLTRVFSRGTRAFSALLLLVVFLNAIPQPAQAAPLPAKTCVLYYQIEHGDTWTSVARKYGISTQELKDANPYVIFNEGRFLCIPRIALTVINPDIEFRAWIFMRWVYVEGKGLPKNHRYTVKARTQPFEPWVHLGTVRINDKGQFSRHFRIPSLWDHAWRIEVCIKDIDYNCVLCTRATHWRY